MGARAVFQFESNGLSVFQYEYGSFPNIEKLEKFQFRVNGNIIDVVK
jgi:hypothetical protein